VDINKIAMKVASVNIEAARRKPKEKAKPKKKPAAAKKKQQEKIILAPSTEYSCRIEMSISTDLEGDSSKRTVMHKLQGELKAAVETAVKITARDLLLDPKELLISVIAFDCDVNAIDGYSDDE